MSANVTTLPTSADRLVGGNVAAEIARAHRTRQSVADAVDIDKGSMSRLIAGRQHWKVTDLFRLADELGCSVDRFLVGADNPRGNPTDPSGTEGYPLRACVTALPDLIAA